jgi:hypothetical protein
MALRPAHKAYVAKLLELLRSDRPLDDGSPPSRSVPMGDDILIYGDRRGLNRWERDAIANIVEWFFKRKDGKKQGRPPDTMLDKWATYSRLRFYEQLVLIERSECKSFNEAIKNVAKRKGLNPSTLKRELARLKRKKSKPYADDQQAVFAEINEQHKYLVLVQDEIDSGKTYDDAVGAVARRQRIDPAKIKRIVKSYFEG